MSLKITQNLLAHSVFFLTFCLSAFLLVMLQAQDNACDKCCDYCFNLSPMEMVHGMVYSFLLTVMTTLQDELLTAGLTRLVILHHYVWLMAVAYR